MTTTTHEVFEQGTAAFNAHDIDAFAELLAEDVVFAAPGLGTGSGRAACAGFFQSWIDAFPDARVEVDAVHASGGDVIVEEGRFLGTHSGVLTTPTGAIPATDRRVEVPYVHVLRFRADKHAYLGLLFDRLLLLEQLGVAPTPEG